MFHLCFKCRKVALWLALILSGTAALNASDGLDQLRGLNVSHVKIPFYHKQQLQAMIFSMHATNQAQNLIGEDLVIELLRKTVDADVITDCWSLPIYPLRASLLKIVPFWRHRILYSQGIIKTAKAEINRQEHLASGGKPVFFRSPALDLDGVGFLADFKKQTLRINSEVKIVLRTGKIGTYGFQGGKIPKLNNHIYATADAMHIDFARKQIILVGEVHVFESRFKLTCDRLTIFLKDQKQAPKNSTVDVTETFSNTGISRFFADGSVVITRLQKPMPPAGEEQQVIADHLLYDVATEKILLTGDQTNPKMRNGSKQFLSGREITLFRKRNQMIVNGQCHLEDQGKDAQGKLQLRTIDSDYGNFDADKNLNDFLGHVKVKDSQMRVYCDQMRVVLHQGQPQKKNSLEREAPLGGIGDMSTLNSGHRELDRIICRSKVVLETVPTPGDPLSRLTADQANLNYRQNLLTFAGHVKLRHVSGKLDSDKLWLFLQDQPKHAASGRVTGVEARSNKTLRKAIALGQVHMVDAQSTLDTDQLTLYFIPAPAGRKGAPGMLQSGNLQISRIYCDGNMVAVNQGKGEKKTSSQSAGALGSLGKSSGTKTIKAQHSLTHLLKNYSEFHQDVVVTDPDSTLTCEDLYVYAKKTANSTSENQIYENDPDADPFELKSENAAPSQVVLANNLELEKVIAEHQVRLNLHNDRGQKQQVGGEHALYEVSRQRITMTGTPHYRPYLQYDNRQQRCDKIVVHLDTERMETIGKTDTITLGN